jgi:hypothetical protein
MTDRYILSRLSGAILAALAVTIFVLPGSLEAARQSVIESVSTEPGTTEPPPTEPETTEPDTTEPATTNPDAAADDDGETGALILAAIAFVALVGVAAVWMIRRPDGDDAPHPHPPARDQPLPGQDLF